MTQSTGGPTLRYEPKVTAGEYVVSTADIARAGVNIAADFERVVANVKAAVTPSAEQLHAINNWFTAESNRPATLVWGNSVKRPGEDWEHYQRHVRRAGWYPRKPRGARP